MIDTVGIMLDRQEKYMQDYEDSLIDLFTEEELIEYGYDEDRATDWGLREEQEEVPVW